MFNGTYDRAARADRYRNVAAEYTGMSEADLPQGLTTKNARAFLIGFIAVWTPILIYTAWITWRIAEAI
jgi:hypothetical protein